jgi:hypothetical protein
MALQVLAVGSIGLGIYQLVIAARNLESPDNDAVRLAGLGLPLIFLAFLNLIVWTQDHPRRSTRVFTHISNGLLLIASALVLRAVPVLFALAVTACAAVIALLSLISEMKLRRIAENKETTASK